MTLNINGLSLAEYKRQIYRIRPIQTEIYEEVLKPEYWAHVATKLNKGDIIEVLPEDDSYFAVLLVKSVKPRAVVVSEINKRDFFESKKQEESEYKIKLRGPKAWSVLKGTDVIYEGFQSRDEAEAKLDEYVAGLAA